MKAVVLGAGRGVNLPVGGKTPKCLLEGLAGWRVLDWILCALRQGGSVDDVLFVGGDGMDRIREAYPELRYLWNERWEEHHVVGSLFAAEAELEGPFYFSYSDIVYRPTAVRALRDSSSEIAIVVDTRWRDRFAGRGLRLLSEAEKVIADGGRVTRIGKDIPLDADIAGEFIGLARFSARGAAALRSTYHTLEPLYANRPYRNGARLDQGFLSDLLQELVLQGFSIDVVTIDGDWAELDVATDLAHFVFGTKAETLERLRPLIKGAEVVDGVWLQVAQWQQDRGRWSQALATRFASGPVAVRSSALAEDALASSMAGRYESVLGVAGGDPAAIEAAVDRVVDSYHKDGAEPSDQILVQHCLTDVRMSGVMMTRDLDSGADYTVIHYDESGSTESVTSGSGAPTRTVQIYRGSRARPADPRVTRLLDVAVELEAITGTDALDVEFAFTGRDELHILQVRPIAAKKSWSAVDREAHRREIEGVRRFLERQRSEVPSLDGKSTILGQMPDWNPAEMIGTHPAPLARSLYERLITDSAWRRARAAMGYGDCFPHRLMVTLAGRPYIDVRCSANNLLPAGLDPGIRQRVVDAGMARLAAHPELHDKIEFEVFPTCLDFGVDAAMARLLEFGLRTEDVAPLTESLRALTDDIVTERVTPIAEQLTQTASLESLCEQVGELLDDTDGIPRRVALLIDGAIERGTIPFSILARQAFVGTALLRSLQDRGVLSSGEVEEFVASVQTVGGELMSDLAAVGRGDCDMGAFLSSYGHLRPGSYDILSPRYDAQPRLYFPDDRPLVTPGASGTAVTRAGTGVFRLDDDRRRETDELLSRLGTSFDTDTLLEFARRAIAGRERAKFDFTRNLSLALELIAAWAGAMGLDREAASQLEIDDVLSWANRPAPPTLSSLLVEKVARTRLRRTVTAQVLLPPLIVGTEDLEVVHRADERPNFVGRKRVTARVAALSGGPGDAEQRLEGRIVLIEGADPGYDWVFTRNIAGLITCFGGANSHMTIRCAEFGLPAAIGCGQGLFARLARAHSLVLDPQGETIRAL